MLIEFSVANFRSIRDKQTLSLVKDSGSELEALNTFPPTDSANLSLVKSVVLYGANASGKSSFLAAIHVMDGFVRNSCHLQRGEKIPVTPFKLSSGTRDEPSEFEVIFYVDGVRYQYGFSATSERVYEEWLFAYPKGRAQEWFSRAWNRKKSVYEWGPYKLKNLTGQKELWKKSTRDNALFLSTAVQLNCEQLQPVFDWFVNTLRMASHEGQGLGFRVTASYCDSDFHKHKVLRLLQNAGIELDGFDVDLKPFDADTELSAEMPASLKAEITKTLKNRVTPEIRVSRKGDDGELVSWDIEEESSGTKRLFEIVGPWLDTLENGYVLFVDELHAYLHPHLVGFLVKLFHNEVTNPKNAQLIFTTHETSILSKELFRRDQVWFIEKENYASMLYPLTDFSPRKDRENIGQYYQSGRYGALPKINDLFEVVEPDNICSA